GASRDNAGRCVRPGGGSVDARALHCSLSWFKSRPGLQPSLAKQVHGCPPKPLEGGLVTAASHFRPDGLCVAWPPQTTSRPVRKVGKFPVRKTQQKPVDGPFLGFRGCGIWSKDASR